MCACAALLHVLRKLPAASSAAGRSSVNGTVELTTGLPGLGPCPALHRDTPSMDTSAGTAGHTQPCSSSLQEHPQSPPAHVESIQDQVRQQAGPCDRQRARQLLAVISMSHPQARVSRGMVKQVTDYFSARTPR